MNLLDAFKPEYMPYTMSGLVGLTVCVIIFCFFRFRKRGELALPNIKNKRSSQWRLQGPSYADRRSSQRREGGPVQVDVTSPAMNKGPLPGYVLDRSTGGLRLALKAGMPPGSTLQIRACHAPDNSPWVTVIVRSNKDTGEHFEIGCEFERTPPWNVLLLFG